MNAQSIRNDPRFRCLFQGETPILVEGNKIIVRHWHWGDRNLIDRVRAIYLAIKPQWEKERDGLFDKLTKQFEEVAPGFCVDVKAEKLRLMFELALVFDEAGHADFEIIGEECPPPTKGTFLQQVATRSKRVGEAIDVS